MSGHSKWHNIQQRKGKQDALRSNLFTKVGRAITMAAKSGGDPTTNFSLRLAIEKAKEVGMPKDNVEKATKRGTGELEGAVMEEALYEAFGPGGAAILVKAVTDNKNRTVSDLKHILSEHGGSLGGAGSVQWMFLQVGVFTCLPLKKGEVGGGLSKEEFELALIDEGAEDIAEDDGLVEIKTKVENLQKVLNKLKEWGVEVKESGIQWMAKDKIKVDKGVEEKLGNLFSVFEENEDISDYFTNAE